MNVPDLGLTPEETSQGSAIAQSASQLATLYNSELTASLTALATQDGLDIHILDAYSLLDQAVADPAEFGLTNVTQPVWTGSYANPHSGHLNATGSAQNGYLFFDQLHPDGNRTPRAGQRRTAKPVRSFAWVIMRPLRSCPIPPAGRGRRSPA